MVGGLPGWSCALNNNDNVIVFVIADSRRQWKGKGGCPGWSVVVSGEERWWDGGLTCSCTPNDNVVVVVIVIVLPSLTVGVYGGRERKSRGRFWRW